MSYKMEYVRVLFRTPPLGFERRAGTVYEHRLHDAQFYMLIRVLQAGFLLTTTAILLNLSSGGRNAVLEQLYEINAQLLNVTMKQDSALKAISQGIADLNTGQHEWEYTAGSNFSEMLKEVQDLKRMWVDFISGQFAIKTSVQNWPSKYNTDATIIGKPIVSAEQKGAWNVNDDGILVAPVPGDPVFHVDTMYPYSLAVRPATTTASGSPTVTKFITQPEFTATSFSLVVDGIPTDPRFNFDSFATVTMPLATQPKFTFDSFISVVSPLPTDPTFDASSFEAVETPLPVFVNNAKTGNTVTSSGQVYFTDYAAVDELCQKMLESKSGSLVRRRRFKMTASSNSFYLTCTTKSDRIETVGTNSIVWYKWYDMVEEPWVQPSSVATISNRGQGRFVCVEEITTPNTCSCAFCRMMIRSTEDGNQGGHMTKDYYLYNDYGSGLVRCMADQFNVMTYSNFDFRAFQRSEGYYEQTFNNGAREFPIVFRCQGD